MLKLLGHCSYKFWWGEGMCRRKKTTKKQQQNKKRLISGSKYMYIWNHLFFTLLNHIYSPTFNTFMHMFSKTTWYQKCYKIVKPQPMGVYLCSFSVAQLGAHPTWSGGPRFDPLQVRQHSFVDIDNEIFATVILSLPLIQEGEISFWRKNVHKY